MSGEPQTEAGRAYLAKLNGSHDDIRRAAILAIEAEAIAQERERTVLAMENEGVVMWGDEGHRARFQGRDDGLREAADAVVATWRGQRSHMPVAIRDLEVALAATPTPAPDLCAGARCKHGGFITTCEKCAALSDSSAGVEG